MASPGSTPTTRSGNVLSFLRHGVDADGKPTVMACIANFSGSPKPDYRVGLPFAGRWREVLNTDATNYGGSGWGNYGGVDAEQYVWHGRPASAVLQLPPAGVLWLAPEPFEGAVAAVRRRERLGCPSDATDRPDRHGDARRARGLRRRRHPARRAGPGPAATPARETADPPTGMPVAPAEARRRRRPRPRSTSERGSHARRATGRRAAGRGGHPAVERTRSGGGGAPAGGRPGVRRRPGATRPPRARPTSPPSRSRRAGAARPRTSRGRTPPTRPPSTSRPARAPPRMRTPAQLDDEATDTVGTPPHDSDEGPGSSAHRNSTAQ